MPVKSSKNSSNSSNSSNSTSSKTSSNSNIKIYLNSSTSNQWFGHNQTSREQQSGALASKLTEQATMTTLPHYYNLDNSVIFNLHDQHPQPQSQSSEQLLYYDDSNHCQSIVPQMQPSSCSNNASIFSFNRNDSSQTLEASQQEMNFSNPQEIDFSQYQELWIRKDWLDITIRVSFVAPIVLLGIIGNLIIIYSMCRFKKFRSKPTNIFILNMAIADLLTTIVCPTVALFTHIYQFYILGSFICRFEGFVKVTCLLVSSYSLIVLSSDWLLCVVKPCRTRITIKQSWLALATIWISSVLMASPLFIWRQLKERQWKDLVEVWCCEFVQYTKYYWIGIIFFLIYLPTIFLTLVLIIILTQMDKFESKLRRTRSSGLNPNNGGSVSINMKYRRRIFKILFTYLLTSVICWTPLHLTIIYRHFRSTPIPSPWFFELAFFSQLSASLTAAMNPIIFGFLEQPFRNIVTKTLMFKFFDKIVTSTPRDSNLHKNEAHAMSRRHNANYDFNKNNNHNNTANHQLQQSSKVQRSINVAEQTLSKQQASMNGSAKHLSIAPGAATGSRGSRSRIVPAQNSSFKQHHDGQQQQDSSKRVSFNTSALEYCHDPQGHANGAYLCNEVPSSPALVQIHNSPQEIFQDLHSDTRQIDTTSSTRGQIPHLRPMSVVSMESINIEEDPDEHPDMEVKHAKQ